MTRRKSSCCCKKGEDCPDGSKKGSCCHPPFRRGGSDRIEDSYCQSGQCRQKCDPIYFPNEFYQTAGDLGPIGLTWTANNDCSTACLGSCCYGWQPTDHGSNDGSLEYFLCTDNVERDDCLSDYWYKKSWNLGQKCVGTICGDSEKVGFCCIVNPNYPQEAGRITVTKKNECSGTWEPFPASGLGLDDIIFSPYGGKYPAGFCGGAMCFYNTLPPYNFKKCIDTYGAGPITSGSYERTVFHHNATCVDTCLECECMFAIICDKALVTFTNSQCPSAGLNSEYSETYSFAYAGASSKAECGEGRTARNLTAFQAFSNLIAYSSDVYYGDYHVVQSRTVTPVVINSSYAHVQLPQDYREIHSRGKGTDCNYVFDQIGNGPIKFGNARCVTP